MLRNLTLTCTSILFSLILSAQVTTSAIFGTITDRNGETLPGATILATHLPSGTSYGVISRDNGTYTIANMRVGGPYRVEVSYTGYETHLPHPKSKKS